MFNSRNNQSDYSFKDGVDEYRPLLSAWLLRLSLMLRWYISKRPSRFLPEIFEDEDFCNMTGICLLEEDEDYMPRRRGIKGEDQPKLTTVDYKKKLQDQLEIVRKDDLNPDSPLLSNISMLSNLIGLNSADQMLLTFTAVLNLFQPFRSAIGARCLRVSNPTLCQILSGLSGIPENDFRLATSDDCLLVRSGMIKISSGTRDLEDKLDLMDGLSAVLLSIHTTSDELVGKFLKKASVPTLTLNNFPHLQADTATIIPYLQNAVNEKTEGVNILFHGKSGVGKTEYVQAIAMELGLDLYEISYSNEDGNSIKGEARLRAYSLCQNLLARTKNSLLMFDEIEDVFPSSESSFLRMILGGKGNDTNGKAWINRTLENNPVPAIWLSNQIDQIDPAYLRRFDYSVIFPTPPASVRLSIAQHHLSCFNPPAGFLERIAGNEETTPAQLDRASKVAKIACNGDMKRAIQVINQVLDKSAIILNQKRMPARNVVRTKYSLEYLNTDIDIKAVVDGLKRRPKGTFCFYGAAGTGKSELVRYLSDEIDKHLLLRRASDIMDMYVGGTEKNIAAMFRDARQQDAILVLDEADSFLSNRQDAQRSWEITSVNELLTQMEAFEGIFICTTNLMEKLDPASLRRFAFKVRFNPLLPNQRWNMFKQELERLGGNLEEEQTCQSMLQKLDQLTAGDFAVVARQFELWNTSATAAKLLNLLQKECEAKGVVTRRIGFGS